MTASRSLTENELAEREDAQFEKCQLCTRFRKSLGAYDACRSNREQWVPAQGGGHHRVEDWQICVTAQCHDLRGHGLSLRALRSNATCLGYQRRVT